MSDLISRTYLIILTPGKRMGLVDGDSDLGTIYHMVSDDIPAMAITNQCIVLDLDLTLLSTQDSMESLSELKILSDPHLIALRNRIYHLTIEDIETPGIGTKYDFWGVTRPHLEEFLIFCFSYFKVVAVWSAGTRPYVEAIIDHIFRDIRPPHVIFTRDDIITGPKGHMEKPLSKMIESNPVLRRHMALQNTLAIDDNSTTFVHNPSNGVLIPAYEPALSVDALSRDDPSLLQLKYWMLQPENVAAQDVTLLDKKLIFRSSVETYQARLRRQPGYKFITS